MKKSIGIAAVLLLLLVSCKTDKKEILPTPPQPELTLLEKIAQANGYEEWKNVNELKFTFNVDKDSTHFERTWTWKPKINEVSSITADTTITYLRKNLDSTLTKTDASFINDKYWLLAPFQLVWDAKSFEFTHTVESEAPISKKPMQKLTIVYKNEGGYTPGDAYDFYFGANFILQEWVFRKENQEEPSMTTTWEDYETINGIKFAKSHKMEGQNFNLNFTGIQIN
ncbi:hypothetical protein Celal_2296 [Cellulophaga algicola DSM 14237]|uniref:Lipoprotein n=1 Tax=Cellulophaga algicola (strain DSM 14237 / IC166 / ACAM 630) TaxID=688270 RepID=E6X6Q0_CELAD|nr:hypothetical protein [Cellulophaga algicola]ADV49588.1 hypothetical protein Celal_2296 [Cellulophaga algicola DSM 14237]